MAFADIAREVERLAKSIHDRAQEPATSIKENEELSTESPRVKTQQVVKVERVKGPITLPPEISFNEAIKQLERQRDYEDEVVNVLETIDAFPWDASNALVEVLAAKYGWVNAEPIPGFFGPKPPVFIATEIAPGVTKNVLQGRMSLPNVTGYIETDATIEEGRFTFMLNAQVKRAHEGEIREIASLVRQHLKTNSIYKGKGIRIAFTDADGDSLKPWLVKPRFMDLSAVKREHLVLVEEKMRQVNDYFFTHLIHREEALKANVPGKRGVLLAGKPGTGKTMTAYVAAQLATQHGITVFYCNSASDFPQVLKMAQQGPYPPALVICEDIERIFSGERDLKIDQLLNLLDGIESKGTDVKVCFTSNDPLSIQEAFKRAGRIDVMVDYEPPDAAAVGKLFRQYGVPDNVEIGHAAAMLAGHIPATIKEVVDRSKLSALARSGKAATMIISQADLELASKSMRDQIHMLYAEPKIEKSDLEKAATVMGDMIAGSIQHALLMDDAADSLKTLTTHAERKQKQNGHDEQKSV
jgi:transitional endoplasmic reticulum ATPase